MFAESMQERKIINDNQRKIKPGEDHISLTKLNTDIQDLSELMLLTEILIR